MSDMRDNLPESARVERRARKARPADPHGEELNQTAVGLDDTDLFKTRRCRVCARTNPPDASYCYFDGRPLLKDLDAPQRMGSVRFPMPFYFSDGQPCANFNELVLACHKNWDEARSILAEGMWPMFFGGIGRFDLAAAVKQAALQPDLDRGLSQFLDRLPADPDFLRPPRVALDSEVKELTLTPGVDRTFDLIVVNDGMLLLEGVAWTDSDWLAFGDGSGNAAILQTQKMFQTRKSSLIKVHVLGGKLRAGLIPLNGKIVVETNGGQATLAVKAAVPIRAFPKGADGKAVLAGAMSPRDIAVKARAAPAAAAALFESGAVKNWYASNGWTYPVEGATGEGKGAVQHFFEVLGLTNPPKLKVKPEFLRFRGEVGEKLTGHFFLYTREAKPIHGQASTNADWLSTGPLKYMGNKIRVPVEVTVPDAPGRNTTADVIIEGNGKQRFVIPVSVMALPQSRINKIFKGWSRASER